MNYLLIGSGGREHAIARALYKSLRPHDRLFCFATHQNIGILKLAHYYQIGDICNIEKIMEFCGTLDFQFAIIGSEAPLVSGVGDALCQKNIPVIGPKKMLAQLESSKFFTRTLLARHKIAGNPYYQYFQSMHGVADCLKNLGEYYVIKANGLMSGKGVKISQKHLRSHKEALTYCENLLGVGQTFLIEEKLIGEEFSVMSFCDGKHVVHMPVVKDFKCAFENDLGLNTGGMGSYSDVNHSLPFLTYQDLQAAQKLNEETIAALQVEENICYKGILYGSYMATRNGVHLIEYNVRFGDPEAINVLMLLKTNFIDICQAIIDGSLTSDLVQFYHQATVCKYLVPKQYPLNSIESKEIFIDCAINDSRLFYSHVDIDHGKLMTKNARSLAIAAKANTIAEAEQLVNAEIDFIRGPLRYRKDIGKQSNVNQHIKNMWDLRHA